MFGGDGSGCEEDSEARKGLRRSASESPVMRLCEFPDCGRKHKARGLCVSHNRQRTMGNPLTAIAGKVDKNSKEAIAARFLTKVEKSDKCWMWRGYVDQLGYGRCGPNLYGSSKAHRSSYLLFKGQIPDGLCVMHTCDVRNCVNPSHLVVGTQEENIADRVRKGRCQKNGGKRGEENHYAKLTEKEVKEIRHKHETGATQRSLAIEYSVSPMAVSRLIRRESWAHVE